MLRKCSKNYRALLGRTPLLSAALLSILTAQTAYSVTCTDTNPYFTIYDCTGGASITATDLPITLSSIGAPLTVLTDNTFGINSSNNAGDALYLAADSGFLFFYDIYGTFITGKANGIYADSSGSAQLNIESTGTVTGIDEDGIYAANSSSRKGNSALINLHNVEGGKNGIRVSYTGIGSISISTTGTVTGKQQAGIKVEKNQPEVIFLYMYKDSIVQGATAAIDFHSDSTANSVRITNNGTIRNISTRSSDTAIRSYVSDGPNTIHNYGLIRGTVVLSGAIGDYFNNNEGATWDTAGGSNTFGIRTDLNSLVNNGTIIAANGTAADLIQTTTFNDVGTFTHNSTGVLTMANGRAGDITVINGNYVGNGGTLIFDSILGGDASKTDKLVINGDTSGSSYVTINNLGGTGAATLDGIELIQVTGLSNGEFIKTGRIVAGAYDYTLQRGAGSNASNWYLSNNLSPIDPINPINPINPVYSNSPKSAKSQRPELGAYTANLAAANTMFVTRLHDRTGETQYIDPLTGEQKVTSMWLRSEGGRNRSRDENSQLTTRANRYTLQLGGDIANWSFHGSDRLHLGLMGGYGNTKSDTTTRFSAYKTKGSITGYSVGAYGTWYANEIDKTGLYLDGWLQYSWFNNRVNGQNLPRESYQSSGITASVESGYTFKLGESTNNWAFFIQPQAQISWMGVKADKHREANGSRITGEGDGNIQTRLGVRTFINDIKNQDKDAVLQLFMEANWIHNSKDFGTTMNGVSIKQNGATNIAELKLGVEGQLNKHVNLWGNISQQVGNNSYSDTSVMLGLKYHF